MLKKLEGVMLVLMLLGCASPEPKSASNAGLRKVSISSSQDVERLRSLGLEIIVQEKDYVVIRQDTAQIRQLQEAAITTAPISETDLVQRLVRVSFASREQLQQIIDMGVDDWGVEGDSLTARAYDVHLARLQAAGIAYRIVSQNAGKPEGDK